MIDRHWDGIAAYCKPQNKVLLGFVEGLNNKIRVIQRRRVRPARRRVPSAQNTHLHAADALTPHPRFWLKSTHTTSRRPNVRINRFPPQSETRKCVRRHVQRVWRGWCNLRVPASRDERARRERGNVIGMDNVVGQTGVIRLLCEFLLEDRGSFKALGISLVSRINVLIYREGIEDPCLDVVGIGGGQMGHCILVRNGASSLTDLGGTLIQFLDRKSTRLNSSHT